MSTVHLESFEFEGKIQQVSFVEVEEIAEGVKCDVYSFLGDDSKDLGIIKIEPGFKTPLQRVLQGTRTVEGYISGDGWLTVTRRDGTREVYQSPDSFSVDINTGDLMQWKAGRERLRAFEICIPPYQDGRYQNLES